MKLFFTTPLFLLKIICKKLIEHKTMMTISPGHMRVKCICTIIDTHLWLF